MYKLVNALTGRPIEYKRNLTSLWEKIDGHTKNHRAVVILNGHGDIIAGNTMGYDFTIALGKMTESHL
jgi:hypothetical protein